MNIRRPDDRAASGAPVQFDVADFREIQNTPKWTLSGTLDYDAPVGGGRLNVSSTLSYRSKSQQFELPIPASTRRALPCGMRTWSGAPGNRCTVGLHGKNLTDKRYIMSGYNFLSQNPHGRVRGQPDGPRRTAGQPGFDPTSAAKAC